jgi:hypothetical protein
MLTSITRDKAELIDVSFVTFMVRRSAKDKKAICSHYEFAYQSLDKRFKFHVSLYGFAAAQAFEETCRFAKSMGIWTIWIDDPNQLFEMTRSL